MLKYSSSRKFNCQSERTFLKLSDNMYEFNEFKKKILNIYIKFHLIFSILKKQKFSEQMKILNAHLLVLLTNLVINKNRLKQMCKG